VVEDVAREAVEEGKAGITVEHADDIPGWLIQLRPVNPLACAVSLAADHPPQIDMFLGPEPTTVRYEFWRDHHAANLTLLRDLLRAVVAGRYRQTITTRRRNRISLTGRFDLPSGEHTHSAETTASGAVEPGETYMLQFEPYQ